MLLLCFAWNIQSYQIHSAVNLPKQWQKPLQAKAVIKLPWL